jgi:hypothetical protein
MIDAGAGELGEGSSRYGSNASVDVSEGNEGSGLAGWSRLGDTGVELLEDDGESR